MKISAVFGLVTCGASLCIMLFGMETKPLVSVAVGGVWFHFFERPFLSAGRRK